MFFFSSGGREGIREEGYISREEELGGVFFLLLLLTKLQRKWSCGKCCKKEC